MGNFIYTLSEPINTPLNYVEIKKLLHEDDDSISTLRERGFVPEHVPPDGRRYEMTYLLIACMKGDLRVVRGLLDLGASITATDEDGFTPLMIACWGDEEERAELVECLLERADVRACIDSAITTGYYSGWTALHCAAYYGNTDVVRVLLLCGADTTKRNIYGQTAVEAAQTSWDIQHYETILEVTLLIEKISMVEWRPWTHIKLPSPVRVAMRTLLLLTKTYL